GKDLSRHEHRDAEDGGLRANGQDHDHPSRDRRGGELHAGEPQEQRGQGAGERQGGERAIRRSRRGGEEGPGDQPAQVRGFATLTAPQRVAGKRKAPRPRGFSLLRSESISGSAGARSSSGDGRSSRRRTKRRRAGSSTDTGHTDTTRTHTGDTRAPD